jgi:uncharacterized protein YecE (DUF72 family)
MGAVHFQFAPWITSAPADLAHVAHCADVMDGYTMAVEFRNKSWFDENMWLRRWHSKSSSNWGRRAVVTH